MSKLIDSYNEYLSHFQIDEGDSYWRSIAFDWENLSTSKEQFISLLVNNHESSINIISQFIQFEIESILNKGTINKLVEFKIGTTFQDLRFRIYAMINLIDSRVTLSKQSIVLMVEFLVANDMYKGLYDLLINICDSDSKELIPIIDSISKKLPKNIWDRTLSLQIEAFKNG